MPPNDRSAPCPLNNSDAPEPALEAIGFNIPASLFRQFLRDILAAVYPMWTPHELTCNPKAALAYCDAIRNRVGCRAIPEAVILRTLLDAAAGW